MELKMVHEEAVLPADFGETFERFTDIALELPVQSVRVAVRVLEQAEFWFLGGPSGEEGDLARGTALMAELVHLYAPLFPAAERDDAVLAAILSSSAWLLVEQWPRMRQPVSLWSVAARYASYCAYQEADNPELQRAAESAAAVLADVAAGRATPGAQLLMKAWATTRSSLWWGSP